MAAILGAMRVGFVGFGLIGGSVARAIKAAPHASAWTLVAWSPRGNGPAEAVADAVLDRSAPTPEAAIDGADLVVLAGPPTACRDALDQFAGHWNTALAPGAVITDVASTKSEIVARANALGLRFVGGHPMAGLEVTGYTASRADLFNDRPWVIVPGERASPEDIDRVEHLARTTGARPMKLDAATHDRAVAGISHVPLILAAALVEGVAGASDGSREDWPQAAELAAGGWRDMTRLARGDPAMGAGIAATNAAAIRTRLADLEAVLASWRKALENAPDEAALRRRLEAVRARLDDRP
jgi:prephenate dehydrogenase